MSIKLGAPALKDCISQVTEVSADYTVLTSDFFIAVLNTSAPRTITLPLSSDVPSGRTFIIKDESGGAGTNNITIVRSGTDNIDSLSSYPINSNRGAVMLVSRPGGYAVI